MKKYNRVMLGQKSKYAVECFEGGFIGTDFGLDLDLTGQLDENWRDFNKKLIPVFLSNRPDKSKVAAGLACGMTWTVAKGLNVGDVVLCPDGTGRYRPMPPSFPCWMVNFPKVTDSNTRTWMVILSLRKGLLILKLSILITPILRIRIFRDSR
jgi:hypothetical protein